MKRGRQHLDFRMMVEPVLLLISERQRVVHESQIAGIEPVLDNIPTCFIGKAVDKVIQRIVHDRRLFSGQEEIALAGTVIIFDGIECMREVARNQSAGNDITADKVLIIA